MKLKPFFLFLLLGCSLAMSAQNITVKSFTALPDDNTATTAEGKRIDQNGDVAALIKMVTDESGLNFEGGALGIVDAKHLQGEVWVWVPRSARKITVKHPKLGVLRDYRYPVEIKAGQTYEMVLEFEEIIREDVTEQFLTFNVTPPTASLEVNDQRWVLSKNGTVSCVVEFGTYTYRASAEGYHPDVGKVKVEDPKQPVTVKVNLRPNSSMVTLEVEKDTSIWAKDKTEKDEVEIFVDGEFKEYNKWTGVLSAGNHRIECKQADHETSVMQKTFTDEMTGQVIKLKAPLPFTGSIKVETVPDKAAVYIGRNYMGETPLFLNNIPVGQHALRIEKEECNDYKTQIEIKKGDCVEAKTSLEPRTCPKGAVNGIFSVSDDKKVYFSKGNLQYQASTGTWRFADNQWDVVGNEIDGNMPGCDNRNSSSTYAGWIDLFPWATSGWAHGDPCWQPYQWNGKDCFSNIDGDLVDANANADWGVYNPISNGGNEAGLWRTLTLQEWEYVCKERRTQTGARYARAKVNGMRGLILLPDSWDTTTFFLTELNEPRSDFENNTISALDWNVLETAGAAFLPAAGYRLYQDRVLTVGQRGCYNSVSNASVVEVLNAWHIEFADFTVWKSTFPQYVGCSVRLVQPCN